MINPQNEYHDWMNHRVGVLLSRIENKAEPSLIAELVRRQAAALAAEVVSGDLRHQLWYLLHHGMTEESIAAAIEEDARRQV